MKNIIKKICSLLALIMIILNSSVLTTLSMAIDEISTNVTANVSNDKKENSSNSQPKLKRWLLMILKYCMIMN